jgi:hypothetical protein
MLTLQVATSVFYLFTSFKLHKHMKNNLIKLSVLFLATSLVLTACKKSDDNVPAPTPDNEEELITTVRWIAYSGTTPIDTAFFRDLDGDGGNAPVIQGIVLDADSAYVMKVEILDESKNPVVDVTEEIEEEADEHQFFYTFENLGASSYTYTDADSRGVPIGLEGTLITGAVSTGNVTIILKHQPDLKPASGNGDVSLGETDIEVEIPVTIQVAP